MAYRDASGCDRPGTRVDGSPGSPPPPMGRRRGACTTGNQQSAPGHTDPCGSKWRRRSRSGDRGARGEVARPDRSTAGTPPRRGCQHLLPRRYRVVHRRHRPATCTLAPWGRRETTGDDSGSDADALPRASPTPRPRSLGRAGRPLPHDAVPRGGLNAHGGEEPWVMEAFNCCADGRGRIQGPFGGEASAVRAGATPRDVMMSLERQLVTAAAVSKASDHGRAPVLPRPGAMAARSSA